MGTKEISFGVTMPSTGIPSTQKQFLRVSSAETEISQPGFNHLFESVQCTLLEKKNHHNNNNNINNNNNNNEENKRDHCQRSLVL